MRKIVVPQKLKNGDEIRVIAPSLSLNIISQENRQFANEQFSKLGLKVTFGNNIEAAGDFDSTPVALRLDDLHAAFSDKNVKAIFTVIGGFNSNQLLHYIDYELIRQHPKIFCGYSDITALQNAIYAKTGMVTYSGPHYSTLGAREGLDFTLEYLIKCLFQDAPFTLMPSACWSDDQWYLDQNKRHFIKNTGFVTLNEGSASGKIIGGNLCTFTLLTGTDFMPSLQNSILFIEDDDWPLQLSAQEFDRNLQSLIHLPDFSEVKGIVIGRFQKKSAMSVDKLRAIVASKVELKHIPVVCDVDFGHTHPMITFPVGGTATMIADKSTVHIQIDTH